MIISNPDCLVCHKEQQILRQYKSLIKLNNNNNNNNNNNKKLIQSLPATISPQIGEVQFWWTKRENTLASLIFHPLLLSN